MDMSGLFIENGFPIAATNEQELKPRATYVNNNISFLAWKKAMKILKFSINS